MKQMGGDGSQEPETATLVAPGFGNGGVSVVPPAAAETEFEAALLQAMSTRWFRMLHELASARNEPAFEPARDAAAARRLARASKSTMPAETAVRVFRAFAGDMMKARGLKAVVIAGGNPAQVIQGARDYFGYGAPLVETQELREAMERVEISNDVVACLPWPELAGGGQWWPMLNENRFHCISIHCGWPNLPDVAETPQVAVLSRLPIKPSGDDDMLATGHDDTRSAVRFLAEAGLTGEVLARARSLTLMRIHGYVAPDDPRLEFARRSGLDSLRIVGVQPRP